MDPQTVTVLLRAWRAGDAAALDELLPLVYEQIHRLAELQLQRERPGHMFSPTDLVSEAYMRMSAGEAPDAANRAHFFSIAARHIRRVLIDHARRGNRVKRGGRQTPVTIDDCIPSPDRPDDVIALDEALQALAQVDDRKARVIEMIYFGGMSQADVATVIGVHLNTVARDQKLGEAWLLRQLRETA